MTSNQNQPHLTSEAINALYLTFRRYRLISPPGHCSDGSLINSQRSRNDRSKSIDNKYTDCSPRGSPTHTEKKEGSLMMRGERSAA